MTKEPWRSASLPMADQPLPRLSLGQAKEVSASPCTTCSGAPCCTYLPLHRFRIEDIHQLDHALYVLNFDRIELGLHASGDWDVYYRAPCRFLDGERYLCRLHDTPAQPRVCRDFDPYGCWYRTHLANPSDDLLRIDRRRMEAIAARIELDDDRHIVAVPDWETLQRELPALEPMPAPTASVERDPVHDPVYERWRAEVLSPSPPATRPRRTYAQVRDPCTGCDAPCCKTLLFPHPVSTTAADLDYLRFCLGFPGLELGVSDGAWSLVVKTTCRHLADNRCSIFGRPERPMLCTYFDASHCAYRTQFGTPRPEGFVHLRLEELDALTSAVALDDTGRIVELPSAEQLRARIERGWLLAQ